MVRSTRAVGFQSSAPSSTVEMSLFGLRRCQAITCSADHSTIFPFTRPRTKCRSFTSFITALKNVGSRAPLPRFSRTRASAFSVIRPDMSVEKRESRLLRSEDVNALPSGYAIFPFLFAPRAAACASGEMEPAPNHSVAFSDRI